MRNAQLQQDLDDEFYGEPIELIGHKTGGDGCAIVSAIVERTPLYIIQRNVEDILHQISPSQ